MTKKLEMLLNTRSREFEKMWQAYPPNIRKLAREILRMIPPPDHATTDAIIKIALEAVSCASTLVIFRIIEAGVTEAEADEDDTLVAN